MSRRSLKFIGFEPNCEQSDMICRRLNRVQDESPSDSTVKLRIDGSGGSYVGRLKIHCMTGPFKAELQCDSLPDLVAQLAREVRMQLKCWRSRRFELPNQALQNMYY